MSNNDIPGPITDRPVMPGYGIATGPDGILHWNWATQRLERSRHYWVATRGADGAPHLAAVWAVWFDGALHFSTGGRSRKARNLSHDARCAVSPADAVEAVVLEGSAREVTDPGELARVRDAYVAKYGEGFPADSPLFAVRPVTAFGVVDAEDRFTTSATRWRFPA
jgi:Pyridoxamine 5'-phosphate oxidase